MQSSQFTVEYVSPLGPLTLASDGKSLTGLWIQGQKYYAATLDEQASGTIPTVFDQATEWLDRYFRGENPALTLPLAPPGSDFRKAVWAFLCAIPYGEVRTYGDIAKDMAAEMGRSTMSAQAVGGAVGHNPISIIIPCHRVVGAAGSLTGYAGGIERKIRLLEREGVDTGTFFVPTKGTAL